VMAVRRAKGRLVRVQRHESSRVVLPVGQRVVFLPDMRAKAASVRPGGRAVVRQGIEVQP
jgi:hypothetical protein